MNEWMDDMQPSCAVVDAGLIYPSYVLVVVDSPFACTNLGDPFENAIRAMSSTT